MRFYRAKQPLSQRQIEITVFLTNYLCKVKAILTCWFIRFIGTLRRLEILGENIFPRCQERDKSRHYIHCVPFFAVLLRLKSNKKG